MSRLSRAAAIPALVPDVAYGPVNAAIRRYTATPDAVAWSRAQL